jgi:phosphate transport system permease protein
MNKYLRKSSTNTWLSRLKRKIQYGDRLWQAINISMSLLVLIIILTIGIFLANKSSDARLKFGWSFIIPNHETAWDPVASNFQGWPFIYGTLITSLLAISIAIPLSLGIAIFLAELCPIWLRTPLGVLVELLAAIPSVVYGLWGIFIFLPIVITPIGQILGNSIELIPGLQLFFSGQISPNGTSRLAAGLILAIMVTPTIAAISRDVFIAIPDTQREASLSLGATQWETISRVLIPYGLSGILGAIILGLGRALGETMAVTMVIGNSINGSLSLLRPGYTMSSIIANEFAETVSELHAQALIEVAFILFVMTLVLNSIARFLVWQVGHRSL